MNFCSRERRKNATPTCKGGEVKSLKIYNREDLKACDKISVIFSLGLILFCVSAFAQTKLQTDQLKLMPVQKYDKLFFNKNDYGVRQGSRTEGVMIWQKGKKIYERFERDYNPQNKHIMWSVSKTVTALLFGVALKEQLFTLDQSICDFVKVDDQKKCAITVKHVLTWSTALYWREEYENASEIDESSVVAMLYGEGSRDMTQFVLSQPMLKDAKPGEVWRYSSGDTVLAAKILEQIYKGQNLRDVFDQKLFAPLGIKDWACEADEKGVLGGAFYFYLALPDMISIGELILGLGEFRGLRLMNEDFIKFMSTVSDAYKKRRLDMKKAVVSGAHLWLNDPQGSDMQVPWPEAPLDTVAAMGHWGQYLVVIPSLNLIAARVGDTRDGSVTIFTFVRDLMSAVGKSADGLPAARVTAASTGATSATSAPAFGALPKGLAASGELAHASPKQKALIKYRDGRIPLGLAFTAKDFCSCLFVAKRSESRCRDYASLKQISPILTFDIQNQTTKSSWFYLMSREAKYIESEKGCRLEPIN